MTANELRARVCAQARQWLGLKEADGSHRQIIDIYNAIRPLPRGYRMTYSDPWCAAFVSAVGAACGLESVLLPECACDAMIAAYKAAERWHGGAYCAEAQPGDLVFYDWGRDGSSDHVGIIADVSASCYTVIEGNYSDAVKMRTIIRGYEHIFGFALPNYEAAEDGTAEDTAVHDGTDVEQNEGQADESVAQTGQKTEQTSVFDFVALPILRYGDGLDDPREDVRAAQFLLIGRGFRCGSAGADGEFGEQTRKAVEQMQRGYNLAVDGVIGAKTWAALIAIKNQ